MKKRNLLLIAILISALILPMVASGAKREKEVPEENFAYIDDDEGYWAKFVANNPDYIHEFIAGKKLGDYKVVGTVNYNERIISTEVEWLNPDQVIIAGPQTVQIKAKYNEQELILTGEVVGIELDEPTTPSLTATTVLLESRTAYDVNLDNKISGSKYHWTSSNPKVVKVNAKNGLVTAVAEGEAVITCEITLPDKTVQVLKSKVIVGYDENAPMLTDTILDLEVGDKYDINVENKIAKSKYRWASSDRSIVRVNSANGKTTAVGKGKAYVTCTITTPENQVIVLKCDINITE
jgi:uncharacterized protein YjdB